MAAASVLPLNTLDAFRVFSRCSLIHKPGESGTFFVGFFFGIQAGTHLTRSDGLQKISIYSYCKSVGVA